MIKGVSSDDRKQKLIYPLREKSPRTAIHGISPTIPIQGQGKPTYANMSKHGYTNF